MPAAVELLDIHKSFSRVKANDGVRLSVERGEVHAIVGENGAGKSTLMKILYGLYAPDRGEIRVGGRPVRFRGPADARSHGLGMVHQHFMLVRNMDVADNVLLGREGTWALGGLRRGRASRELHELSQRYGLQVDPSARVEDLPVGVQQRVEILRVLAHGAEILIFDEPTAVLTPLEVAEFFRVLRRLREQGKTSLLITHKLDEVMAVSDRVTVMRSGRVVGSRATATTSPTELANLMVGRDVLLGVERRPGAPEGAVLEVRDLEVRDARRLPAVRGVSFTVRAGEIVGFAGVEGNGQTELIEAITGLRAPDSGSVRLAGTDITRAPVRRRYAAGLAHVPEDRHKHGLVLEMSVAENLLLGRQWEPEFSSRGLLRRAGIASMARARVRDFDVRPPDPEIPARDLSGGNQQKVVLARELTRAARLVLAAQPTRGVDIGATEFIHAQLLAARDEGRAVLLISADLQEVMRLADRILVLYRGRVAGEARAEEATEEQLGLWMLGGAGTGVETEGGPAPLPPPDDAGVAP
ncbi:MAG: ABC transporter ATP-binding protein [Candidatus Eisenbacteria bacterium]|nr:ABC transporter ATP-binding protein [Candidatus Eisenbacteria bacterium]